MFCEHCGTKKEKDAQFCQSCGKTTSEENTTTSPTNVNVNQVENKLEAIIKCGNCDYIGPGEPARSMWAMILAWLCVFFAPLITIIYFVATHKYRCPKCKSTFLGVKNKEGVFVAKKGSSALGIFLIILVGIAIIGILASVVLASLNTARSKGQDASIKANLANTRAQAELYWDSQSTNGKNGSYFGFCGSDVIVNIISSMPKVKDTSPVCNDSKQGYAMDASLNSGGYWCVDSSGKSENTNLALYNKTSCSPK